MREVVSDQWSVVNGQATLDMDGLERPFRHEPLFFAALYKIFLNSG
jgi:hypothetical protein